MELITKYEFLLKMIFLLGITIGCNLFYKRNKEWLKKTGPQKWSEDIVLKILVFLGMFLSYMGGGFLLIISLLGVIEKLESNEWWGEWYGQLLLCTSIIVFFFTLYMWWDLKKDKSNKNRNTD